jgi:cysteinyl-tRNA synthetase
MQIFNTMTRTKEELIPHDGKEFKIYACGPTVYNFIHIGNARPLCVFDVLRRYLEYRGNKVNFVQNFTDIDDKLIKKANEEGTTVLEVAKRYIQEFWTDAKGLNVREATVHPKATENIDAISRKGDRYSIKSTSTSITGVFYGLEPKDSEYIDEKKI